MSGIGGRISWSFLSGKRSAPVVKSPAKVLPPTSPPPPPPPPVPSLVSNPVISGTPQVSQTLTSTSGVWLNSPTVVSYQWFRGATPVGTNSATYVLVLADLGALISCLVTVANGFGSANATSAAVGPVINLAPVNTVLPVITGTTTQGATLSVSNGTWTNTPLSFSYQWKRGGVAITSANSATYLLVLADVGAMITCTVTATNTGGSTPATSASVGPIGAASSALSIVTAPSLSGDAVVGQTIFAINGTYSAAPDTITPSWYVGGVLQTDQAGTTLLVLDQYAGLAIGYIEVAHKAAYTDSASNAATSTGAVANISLTNAITAFTRTSTSGTVPMTWSVTFAANVYEGYYLRAQVFSDGTLSTQTQDITHRLTHADLQSGATIDLTSDGLTTIGATQYLQLGVFTTSPNSIPATFTYGTTISPTDAIVPMTWDASNKTANATLSAGNLTITGSGGAGAVARTVRAVSGAKYYAEFAVNGNGGWAHIDLVDNTLSVGTVETEMAGQTDGADVHAAAFQCFDNFDVYTKFNNVSTHNSTLWLNNQPVDICWNDTMFWWRQNNGAWQPSGSDPSAGTGGINITSLATPRYIFGGPIAANGVLTANFGTTPGGTAGFTRTIPTGAVAP